jgi:hypothetical protein
LVATCSSKRTDNPVSCPSDCCIRSGEHRLACSASPLMREKPGRRHVRTSHRAGFPNRQPAGSNIRRRWMGPGCTGLQPGTAVSQVRSRRPGHPADRPASSSSVRGQDHAAMLRGHRRHGRARLQRAHFQRRSAQRLLDFGPVAQWLEPTDHNGLVGGSNPPGPARTKWPT